MSRQGGRQKKTLEAGRGTDDSGPITPLLSDPNDLRKEYRQRNNDFVFKSAPSHEAQSMLDAGWEIAREGTRVSRFKKPKKHSQKLEDRVWCLFYKMGYRFLNGRNARIIFTNNTGSEDSKQVDVFACDDDTAFVIECKSSEERKRRSLVQAIRETASLKEKHRLSINGLYAKRRKPKIVWAYVTNKIIWSEEDVRRAQDENLVLINENALQYYEAFIKQMGAAGKYQFAAEFLKGQKIPGLTGEKLPAVRGKIGGETFYSFVVSPRRLLKIAFINHHALDDPEGRPAYQRMISSSRIKEIGKFIQKGGYFPTNILINFMDKPRFDPMENKENSDPKIKFGWITLPSKYKSAWIIDGQHRLYGYSPLDESSLDQSLFVLAFEKMAPRKEADLFTTINHKQKSVPRNLLTILLADLRLDDPDPSVALTALCSLIVREIDKDTTSPLLNRFGVPGIEKEHSRNLTVSEAVKGLRRSGLIRKIVRKGFAPGPLSAGTDEETVRRSRKIINKYFKHLEQASPQRWIKGQEAYISVNPGIRAHLQLIAEIVEYIRRNKGIDFHTLREEQFTSHICKIADPIFDYIKNASDADIKDKFSRKFGEGGVKEYFFHLCKIIREEYEDFGPEEFRELNDPKISRTETEAKEYTLRLIERMVDAVVKVLRQIHGEQVLASGQPAFWEKGVQSRKVLERTYEKQQADSEERKTRQWAYLDILDLREIIRQKNNWPHFEHIFNLRQPDEKKGKIYYLQWMESLNSLRNMAAYRNPLRRYTERDIEFIDWLRSELEPKMEQVLKE